MKTTRCTPPENDLWPLVFVAKQAFRERIGTACRIVERLPARRVLVEFQDGARIECGARLVQPKAGREVQTLAFA